MTIRRLPGEERKEEITGELVEYLRTKSTGRLLMVYLIDYAYDRRNRSHEQNPWVLAWYDHGGGVQLPSKMPLWMIEAMRSITPDRRWCPPPPLAWSVVPPAQGELF